MSFDVPAPKQLSFLELEKLWIAAGGAAAVAPIMAAIALGESSGIVANANPNDTGGQFSGGLWQISNGTNTPPAGWNDPLQNARYAVQKLATQGFNGAWGLPKNLASLSWADALTVINKRYKGRVLPQLGGNFAPGNPPAFGLGGAFGETPGGIAPGILSDASSVTPHALPPDWSPATKLLVIVGIVLMLLTVLIATTSAAKTVAEEGGKVAKEAIKTGAESAAVA